MKNGDTTATITTAECNVYFGELLLPCDKLFSFNYVGKTKCD